MEKRVSGEFVQFRGNRNYPRKNVCRANGLFEPLILAAGRHAMTFGSPAVAELNSPSWGAAMPNAGNKALQRYRSRTMRRVRRLLNGMTSWPQKPASADAVDITHSAAPPPLRLGMMACTATLIRYLSGLESQLVKSD